MNPAATTSCDRATANAAVSGAAPAHARATLIACILASSLAFIDGSVVNVALPAVGSGLQTGGAGLQWVINAYLLPLSALLLAGGAAGDLYGRRKLLIAGVALFAGASVMCALSPGLAWLLIGRALQGTGAALVLPNSLAILGSAFSGEARGRAVGLWAATGAAVGAAGPLLGGWLVDHAGWRAIFYINLPVAAATIALAAVYVHDTRDQDRPPLDAMGMVLASAGLGAITWGLTAGSGPAGPGGASAATFAAGMLGLVAFVWFERRRGERAMLPTALFGSLGFVGLSLFTFLLYAALGGLLVLLPYVLIEASGYSATRAGAALLPFPLIMAVLSPVTGRMAARLGPRPLLTLGALGVAGGFFLCERIDGAQNYWTTVFPALAVFAVGMAGAAAPLTTAVLASVDARHTGVASGFNSALARTGGLIATALLGAALAVHGPALVTAFHIAAAIGGGCAIAAAICILVLLRDARPRRVEPDHGQG